MAANTTPVYPITANHSWGTVVTTANNTYDGTGTQVTLITGGTYGTDIKGIRLMAMGTNVATVARFFLNNGSDNTSAGNNAPILEVALPATTASASALTTPGGAIIVPLEFTLKASYKINMCIGTTVASGWKATILKAGDI
jgi:hypothetical protein